MADGQQQPKQSPEAQKQAALPVSSKREELLRQSKERISRMQDVNGDGSVDQKDAHVKEQALQFISTECLGLPEDRFLRLLEEIEIRMRQKESYKRNLFEEFREARKKVIQETEGTKFTQFIDQIKDNSPVDRELLRDYFRPDKIDVQKSADYLEHLSKDPKCVERLSRLILEDDKRIAGFLTYWNSKHPVLAKLQATRSERALKMMTAVESMLRDQFGISRDIADNWDAKDKKAFTQIMNVVRQENGSYDGGHKYVSWVNNGLDKAGTKLREAVGMERKIMKHNFRHSPEWMNEEDFSDYVNKSANYLQYVVESESWEKDFIRTLELDRATMSGFLKHWGPDHPVRMALKARKLPYVVNRIDAIRKGIMDRHSMTERTVHFRNEREIGEIIRTGVIEAPSISDGRRMQIVYSVFGTPAAVSDMEISYLKMAAYNPQWKEWERFVKQLEENPAHLRSFLIQWPNGPLGKALNSTEGGEAVIKKFDSEKLRLAKKLGLNAQDVEGWAAQVDKAVSAKSGEMRKNFEKRMETEYEKQKGTILSGMGDISKALVSWDKATVDNTKARLTRLSDGVLTDLHNDAIKLYSGANSNPMLQKVLGLRLAIAAINDISMSGSATESLSSLSKNGWTTALAETKTKQVEAIIGGKHSMVMTFKTELNGLVRVYGLEYEETINEQIKTGKKPVEQTNPEAFSGILVRAHLSGNMNVKYFENAWGKENLASIALYWKGGGDKEKEQLRKLIINRLSASSRSHVLEAFQKVLDEALLPNAGQSGKAIDALKKVIEAGRENGAVIEAFAKKFPSLDRGRLSSVLLDIQKNRPGTADIIRKLAPALSTGELSAKDVSAICDILVQESEKGVLKAKKQVEESDYGNRIVGELRAFKENLLPSSEKEPEDAKFLNGIKNKKTDALDPAECKTLFGILKKQPNWQEEMPNFVKFLEGRIAVYEKQKQAGELKAAGANPHAVASAVNGSQSTNPEARKKGESEIASLNKVTGAAGEVRARVLDLEARKKAVEDESKPLLEKLGYGKLPLEDLLKDRALSEQVMRDLEKNGETASSLYRALVGHRATIREFAVAKNQFEKEFGTSLGIPANFFDEAYDKPKNSTSKFREAYLNDSDLRVGNRTTTEKLWESGRPDSATSVFFERSQPGESVRISDGIMAVKTQSGGLEIVTPGRTLKFDANEALGATEQIDLLKGVGAEFLIPSLKDIARYSEVSLKWGISRTESANLVRILARSFGYASVLDEKDPKAMVAKFRAHATGAIGGETLSAQARRMGIIKSWSLNAEALDRQLEMSHASLEASTSA